MISSTYELWSFMQGPEKISTKERSFAELRFASSLAPFWVWPGRRQGSAMNAYGALDPGLATQLPSCGLFSLQSPNKSVDNAERRHTWASRRFRTTSAASVLRERVG